MTALRIHADAPLLPAPAPAPRPPAGAEWVHVAEAALLLGKSEGQLRRLCADELHARGLATKRVVSRRARAWHVHVSVSPLLTPASLPFPGGVERPAPADLGEFLRSMPARVREDAARKIAIVRRFRAWRSAPGVRVVRDFPAFRADLERTLGVAPSLRQLYEWCDLCPSVTDGADLTAAIVALVDRRGRAPGGESCHPECWALFESLALTPQQPSVAQVWRAVRAHAEKRGLAWPSLSRVKQLRRERIDQTRWVMMREGEDAWRKRFSAPLEQHPEAWGVGERWESDHSRLDFFCRVPCPQAPSGWRVERPWLTTWFDWRTRLVVGWTLSTRPSADTIRAALLSALRDDALGVPRLAWLDNGKDFDSFGITGKTKRERQRARGGERHAPAGLAPGAAVGLLAMFGIEHHAAQPYNHNGKARMERFFGTLHGDFDRGFATYCGHTPGVVDRDALEAAKADLAKVPTIDDVRARLGEWMRWYNRRDEHAIDDLIDPATGERLSPLEFYTRHLGVRRVLPDRGALRLLEQRWERPVSVGKRGVSIDVGGGRVWYGSTAPELERFKGTGEKVFVTYDPEDLSVVNVWDAAVRHVCAARRNEMFGAQRVTREAMRAAMAERRQQARAARQRVDLSRSLLTVAELAAVRQREAEAAATDARLAAERAARPAGADPSLRIVRTPVDGQAERVERAERALAARPAPAEPDGLDLLASSLGAGADDYGADVDLFGLDAPEPADDDEPGDVELSFDEPDDGYIDVLSEIGGAP